MSRGLGAGIHNDSSCRSADRGLGRIFEIRGEVDVAFDRFNEIINIKYQH